MKIILALEYKAAPMGGTIFCDSEHCWGSTPPRDFEYDIQYICADDLINNEQISDEEFIKLDRAFFTLYIGRKSSYFWNFKEKEERNNAINYLINSGLTRRFENEDSCA